MELVEGDDLSRRIALGAIPPDEALHIAKQIAEALEAAHERGIIHRDLKPANIKLRPDGKVKVLDFGLAKAMDQGSGIGGLGSGNLANSPTITSPAMTIPGVILGTAAYMSPEQGKGRVADKRADIWAFGVVFYEMLTGRRAFEGEDVSSIMAAVIQSEPRWAGVPASVRRLLESCLTKDPKKRLRDIGDVWRLLDDQPAVTTRTETGILGWAAAGLLALHTQAAFHRARSRRCSRCCGLKRIWGRTFHWCLSPSPPGFPAFNPPLPTSSTATRMARFLLTAGGLPLRRMSPGDSKCMSGRLPRTGRRAANGG